MQAPAVCGRVQINEIIAWYEAGQRQTEHRVDGDAAGIDCCNSCGSNDDDILPRPLDDLLQQRSFAGPGLSRDKAVLAREESKLFGKVEFDVGHIGIVGSPEKIK
jgi:hypothetical protein